MGNRKDVFVSVVSMNQGTRLMAQCVRKNKFWIPDQACPVLDTGSGITDRRKGARREMNVSVIRVRRDTNHCAR
jgi:hypothetical protein